MRSKVYLSLIAFLLAQAGTARVSAQFPRTKYHRFVEGGLSLRYAPIPEYPFEVRQVTGSGIAVVKIDPSSGQVTDVTMAQSTGNEVLDRSAVAAFRQWRFIPGVPPLVKIPVTFGKGGQVTYEIKVKESRSMDEVLAGFLGKGTVINGPIPKYPASGNWTEKQGKGVYELHVGGDGKVAGVRILKTSGDATFDRVAVETLKKWRLRTGPKVIELPLAFKLTPKSYDVGIP